MSEPFDPYYHWLGIPPHEQPPNHYRLLSIQLFEPNPQVIQNAVDRLMAHLRTFQTGRRAAESQRLLNEISRAKICLLNPKKRAEYDRKLKAQLSPAGPPVTTAPASEVAPAPTPSVAIHANRPGRRRTVRKRSRLIPGLVTFTVLLAVAAGAFWWFNDFKIGSAEDPNGRRKPEADAANTIPSPDSATFAGDQDSGVARPDPSDVPTGPNGDDVAGSGPGGNGSSGETATGDTRAEPFDERPLPDELRLTLEDAQGTVTDDFAACQALPLGDAELLAARLRPFGYRLVRVRPYPTPEGNKLCALWRRDGVPWRLVTNQTLSELQETTERFQELQFVAEDVAGYEEDGLRFLSVYRRTRDDEPAPELSVGQTEGAAEQLRERFIAEGFRPTTVQVVRVGGEAIVSQIWVPSAVQLADEADSLQGILRGGDPLLPEDARIWPADLTVWTEMRGGRPALIWRGCPLPKVQSVRVLAGFDVSEHRAQWSEAIQHGFLPASIAVASMDDHLIGYSVWTRDRTSAAASRLEQSQMVGPFPEVAGRFAGPVTGTGDASPAAGGRQPIPAPDELGPMRKELEERFAIRLAQAESPTARSEVARTMLDLAGDESEFAKRFVLLEMAISEAARAGNIELAFAGIQEQAKVFAVDALSLQAEVLDSSRSASRYLLAWVAFELAEKACDQARWDIAKQAANMGGKAARASRNKMLARALREQLRWIQSSQRLASLAETAATSLQHTPDDSTAQLNVGLYQCFVKQQWQQGLSALAQGSDVRLAEIATQELHSPTTGDQRLTLADAWFQWSQDQTDQLAEAASWRRALKWYVAALPELNGDEKDRAEKQVSLINGKLWEHLWWRDRRLPWVDGAEGALREFTGHDGPVGGIAVSQDGHYAVSGSQDGTIRVWDLISGAQARELQDVATTLSEVQQVELVGNDRLLVARGDVSRIGVWDPENGKVTAALPTPHRPRALAASHLNTLIGSALDTTSSNNLQIVDVQVPRTVAAFSWGHRVNCLAFSPDDGRLAGGDNHNQIVVWDLVAGAELFRIPMQGPVNDVRFSPNGYRLAAATRQGLFVFDAVLGRLMERLSSERTSQIRYLPNGRLVSLQSRGGVQLWDSASSYTASGGNTQVTALRDVTALAALPDSRAILIGVRSGKLMLWRLPDRPLGP
jgi:hypothetical protein